MSRKFNRKAVAAIGVVILLSAAGAYAYWTNGGSGTGSGTTGTNSAVVVNQTSVVAGLYPGGPTQALSGNFTNPNPGPVYVTAVTATVTPTGAPGCTSADYAITGTATVGHDVASGTNVDAWSGLSIAMVNSAENQDACKNAALTISYTST